jgi:hypothetical protein
MLVLRRHRPQSEMPEFDNHTDRPGVVVADGGMHVAAHCCYVLPTGLSVPIDCGMVPHIAIHLRVVHFHVTLIGWRGCVPHHSRASQWCMKEIFLPNTGHRPVFLLSKWTPRGKNRGEVRNGFNIFWKKSPFCVILWVRDPILE